MKKFLSLVMALVMTMSLVTIGAGATEYKDFTDKGEVKYAEAVAVLNKIGIITGYEDGSFKPTGALTRGAAAKIIVSLMIGSEAASSLTVTAAPYSDVPVTNTFAAVISYCKTAGYINGYADGTFRPAGALTGYAFAKMLLGALGYDGKVEGFSGSGWTMNVAKLGNKAGLFNDFATAFKGNDGVNRESACLLALNTIKGTQVEYIGNNVTVTGDNLNVTVGNNLATPVTSANGNINGKINNVDTYNGQATLEFGEEHFTGLQLVSTSADDEFSRPSNQWSYNGVTIGTYAKTPTYTFTSGKGDVTNNTDAENAAELGMKGFKLASGSTNWYDLADTTAYGTPRTYDNIYVNGVKVGNISTSGDVTSLADYICNLTGNGRQVLVYIDPNQADRITDIVVIDTYTMKVDNINTSAKTVTLKNLDGYKKGVGSAGATVPGAAYGAMTVVAKNVNNEDVYNTLSTLKKDDIVLVTASGYTALNPNSVIETVTVPTAVNGKIGAVSLNKSRSVNGVTVAGTAYKLQNNFYSEDSLVPTSVSTTVTSVAYLDSYGYVAFMKDMSASTSYILVNEFFTSTVDGRNVQIAEGYDMSGNALSLNLGTNTNFVTTSGGLYAAGGSPNRVYAYSSQNTQNHAEYRLIDQTVAGSDFVSAGSITIANGATGISSYYFASGVNFMFASYNGVSSEITGVTLKSGAQTVSTSTAVYYTLDKDGRINNVIVLGDSDITTDANVLYVAKKDNQTTSSDGKTAYTYTVYIDGAATSGVVSKNDIANNSFCTYAVNGTTGEYTLNTIGNTLVSDNKGVSVMSGVLTSKNGSWIELNEKTGGAFTTTVDTSKAQFINLTDNTSLNSLSDLPLGSTQVSVLYNNSNTSSKAKASFVFVWGEAGTMRYSLPSVANVQYYTDAACTPANQIVTLTNAVVASSTVYAKIDAAAITSGITSVTNGAATLVTYPVTGTGAVYKLDGFGTAAPSFSLTASQFMAATDLATGNVGSAVDNIQVSIVSVTNANGEVLDTANDYIEKGQVLTVRFGLKSGTDAVGGDDVTISAANGGTLSAPTTAVTGVLASGAAGTPVTVAVTASTAGKWTTNAGAVDCCFDLALTVGTGVPTLSVA